MRKGSKLRPRELHHRLGVLWRYTTRARVWANDLGDERLNKHLDKQIELIEEFQKRLDETGITKKVERYYKRMNRKHGKG